MSRAERGRPGRSASTLGLRRLEGDRFELIHPPCVEERRDDLDDALEMARCGEPLEARDALRFALEGCGDNLEIHVALGRIALHAMRDPALARGHFGYAVELVQRGLPPGFPGVLPTDRPGNRPFYDALNGLVACCEALGRAAEVAELRRMGDALAGRTGRAAP